MHIVFLGAIMTMFTVVALLISHRNQDIALIDAHCRALGQERSRQSIAEAIDENRAYRICWLLILSAVVTGNLGSAGYVLGRPHVMAACLGATILLAVGGMLAMAQGCRAVMQACAAPAEKSAEGSATSVAPPDLH